MNEADEGIKVVHSQRLCEAEESLERAQFDVVLLDLSLPDARGIEALTRTRKKAPHLPIVVLSGLDDNAVALRAVQMGAQDYLVKGQANASLLIRAIRYAIERQRSEEELRRARDQLEVRVRERTAEIEQANQSLVDQIAEGREAEEQIRHLNQQLAQRIRRIDALRQVDRAISSSLDLRLTLDIILVQVMGQLQVDAADVLLCNEHCYSLEYFAGAGFCTDGITRSRLKVGQGWAGRAAMKRCAVSIPKLAEPAEPFERAALLMDEGFISYYALPLLARGHLKGVLEIFQRKALNVESDFRDFIEILAQQAAVAIDNASLWEDVQRSNVELMVAYDATIEGWARVLDLRAKETEGHTRRVTAMTVRLARTMGVGEAELVHVRRGALLHDIGKMGIPDEILQKTGALTDQEWSIMRRHPDYAHEWLAPISFLCPALDIPYCHHEKWDGSGYPRGIARERIPLQARIFAAVDVWDALRFDRPYRKGWPDKQVIEYLRSISGTHLDPQVVQTFLHLLVENKETCT